MKASSILLALAAVLAVGVSFVSGCRFGRRGNSEPSGKPDTVEVVKWVHDSIPVPYDSIIVKWKPVYLPIHDTTEIHDTTAIHDSVMVDVPITEKTYLADDYKATVRGFEPELVDIWIKQKETTITVPYRKRWSVTVGPQLGVGYTPKGWQPYAGAGVTFGYSF